MSICPTYNLHLPTISWAAGFRRVLRNELKSDALWYKSDDDDAKIEMNTDKIGKKQHRLFVKAKNNPFSHLI